MIVANISFACISVLCNDSTRGNSLDHAVIITHSAEVIVAGALAVELASTEVDVRGAVAVHPGLGNKASRAGVAGVESNRLENGEHGDDPDRRGRRFIRDALFREIPPADSEQVRRLGKPPSH